MRKRATSLKRTKEAEKEVKMEEKEVTKVEDVETLARKEDRGCLLYTSHFSVILCVFNLQLMELFKNCACLAEKHVLQTCVSVIRYLPKFLTLKN